MGLLLYIYIYLKKRNKTKRVALICKLCSLKNNIMFYSPRHAVFIVVVSSAISNTVKYHLSL